MFQYAWESEAFKVVKTLVFFPHKGLVFGWNMFQNSFISYRCLSTCQSGSLKLVKSRETQKSIWNCFASSYFKLPISVSGSPAPMPLDSKSSFRKKLISPQFSRHSVAASPLLLLLLPSSSHRADFQVLLRSYSSHKNLPPRVTEGGWNQDENVFPTFLLIQRQLLNFAIYWEQYSHIST